MIDKVQSEKPGEGSLSHISTHELHNELIKREGVEATFLGPKDDLTKHVTGPAWVIVNRD